MPGLCPAHRQPLRLSTEVQLPLSIAQALWKYQNILLKVQLQGAPSIAVGDLTASVKVCT